MRKIYPAIIHDDEDGYWIEFPDLEGCLTEGDSLEELMEHAEEALGAYLAYRMDEGLSFEKPSDIKTINAEGNSKTYISTDVSKYRRNTKAVKKMVSIPEWMDREVNERNLSLSKILQEALTEKYGMA